MSTRLTNYTQFEFVNVPGPGREDLSHRHQVRSHIQAYRRRHKAQRVQDLLRSSAFHRGFCRSQPTSVTPTAISNLPHASQIDDGNRSNVRYLPPVLHLILDDGRIDPFDTLPEPLDGIIQALLSFETCIVYPALQRLEYNFTHARCTFAPVWYAGTRAYVHDPLTIYSYLARAAATMYMSTMDAKYLDAAQIFRCKAINNLQLYTKSGQSINLIRFYRALTILLFAENALGNKELMETHTKLLTKLFFAHESTLKCDPSLLAHEMSAVVYQDVQLAVLMSSRTVFDLTEKGWIHRQLHSVYGDGAVPFIEARRAADRSIDSYLTGKIRVLLLDAQEVLCAMALLQNRPADLEEPSMYFPISLRVSFGIGRCMNYFVDLTQTDTSDLKNSNNNTVAAVCLCIIYWLRYCAKIENFKLTDSLNIFQANPAMIERLRIVTERLIPDDLASFDLSEGRQRLILWVLFTGAHMEKDVGNQLPNIARQPALLKPRWFATKFASSLLLTQIRTWEQCCVILVSFCLPVYFMEESPEQLFYTLRDTLGVKK